MIPLAVQLDTLTLQRAVAAAERQRRAACARHDSDAILDAIAVGHRAKNELDQLRNPPSGTAGVQVGAGAGGLTASVSRDRLARLFEHLHGFGTPLLPCGAVYAARACLAMHDAGPYVLPVVGDRREPCVVSLGERIDADRLGGFAYRVHEPGCLSAVAVSVPHAKPDTAPAATEALSHGSQATARRSVV